MKKNKISKNWIIKQHKDRFFKESKIKGYRSRSAFKILEIDKKFHIFKKNTILLDLGSSPGGWSQVAAKKILNGEILAVDVKFMERIENVNFILGDFLLEEIQEKIKSFFSKKINLVISDMSPNTTGNKSLDSYRSANLCLNAMEYSKKILKKDGVFLSKFFMGKEFKDIEMQAKNSFKTFIKYKPMASRKESREMYILCKNIIN